MCCIRGDSPSLFKTTSIRVSAREIDICNYALLYSAYLHSDSRASKSATTSDIVGRSAGS